MKIVQYIVKSPSSKMASTTSPRKCMSVTNHAAFERFIEDNFNGDISDADLSDDNDERDPSYVQNEANGDDTSSSSGDEEEEEACAVVTDSTTLRGCFWKKTLQFDPLPPAPEYTPPVSNPVNLPPEDYLSKYIPQEIYVWLCDFTNQRYLSDTGKILNCSVEEMRVFFGVTVAMSYLGYPRIKMYWAKKTRVAIIADNISRDRYFVLRNNLKLLDDNSISQQEKDSDKFWKVSPIIKCVLNGCRLNPRSKDISIDEQICPFWGHVAARQVIRTKPNPCGIKIFVAAAPDGLPLNFFIYQGKGHLSEDPGNTGLDVGGKAVLKLAETLPSGVTLYLDRFFTSVALFDLLHFQEECQATGTIQKNRIPRESKLKDDGIMKKCERGSVDQSVRSDGQVCIVKWFDNRPVTLISTKEGVSPEDQCRRWSKKDSKYIMVNRPSLVKSYNQNMGGVDFLDRVISTYRIRARTRKWTIRLIFHMFDFAIAASWIEYRRDQRALGTRKSDTLDYLKFCEKIEEHLIHSADGSDSNEEEHNMEPKKKHHRASVPHPADALRLRRNEHMPEFPTPVTKNRCRLPGCGANSARIRCSTCKVFLCLQETRNCFQLYHSL